MCPLSAVEKWLGAELRSEELHVAVDCAEGLERVVKSRRVEFNCLDQEVIATLSQGDLML